MNAATAECFYRSYQGLVSMKVPIGDVIRSVGRGLQIKAQTADRHSSRVRVAVHSGGFLDAMRAYLSYLYPGDELKRRVWRKRISSPVGHHRGRSA